MTNLVMIPVNQAAFGRWSGQRDLTAFGRKGPVFDPDHAMHVLLSALFGKGVAQPYRLQAPERGGWTLYLHTGKSVEELREMATLCGSPEMLDVIDLDGMRGKPVPEVSAGKRIGYEIRLQPSVRAFGKQKDPWVRKAELLYEGNIERMKDDGPGRDEVYANWFDQRLGDAALLETCRMSRFHPRAMVRSGRVTRGTEICLQGTLTVRDAVDFNAKFATGIGREKAYGFGLLMLRPPEAERDPGL